MNRAGLLLTCGLLLGLTACAGPGLGRSGGPRETAVEAEGWAPVTGDDVPDARRRALAEAQKKAVEKAVGVTLRARTRVDDAISVRQSIEANMGGTIDRYEIASEGRDGGYYKVAIRAVVLERPLAAEGTRRLVPRLSVRIAGEKVLGAVRAALAARDLDLSETEGDADVVATGVVETRGLSDPRLGGFYSYTAKVTLNAANLRDGKVYTAQAEASAVDLDERVARDGALEKAGEASGAALAEDLAGKAPETVAAAPGN
jgi:hypothetical protein